MHSPSLPAPRFQRPCLFGTSSAREAAGANATATTASHAPTLRKSRIAAPPDRIPRGAFCHATLNIRLAECYLKLKRGAAGCKEQNENSGRSPTQLGSPHSRG